VREDATNRRRPTYRGLSTSPRRIALRVLGGAIAVIWFFAPATKAFALWDDRLQLFVEEKVTRDDNVFRLSKDVDPEAFGVSSRGDTYHTTSPGFNLDVPVSRQRFQARYAWNATRFDRFTDLDFDGQQFVVTAWLRAPKQAAA